MGLKSVEKGGKSIGIIPTLRSSSIVRDDEWQSGPSCVYNMDGFSLLKFAGMGTIL